MGRLNAIENLITSARVAGLRLQVDGDLLRIKGNREAADIARELLERKAEVFEYLTTGADENPEVHDSALFDVVIIFHGFPDGPAPLRIPQQSTPPGWTAPF